MKNPTLLQTFHWYSPDGGALWPELRARAGALFMQALSSSIKGGTPRARRCAQ